MEWTTWLWERASALGGGEAASALANGSDAAATTTTTTTTTTEWWAVALTTAAVAVSFGVAWKGFSNATTTTATATTSTTTTSAKTRKNDKPLPTLSDPTQWSEFNTCKWVFEWPRGEEGASDGEFGWNWDAAAPQKPWPPFNPSKNVNASDVLMVEQTRRGDTAAPAPSDHPSVRAASAYAARSQHHGYLPNDYGGPMFLLPGLVISLYVTARSPTVASPATRRAAETYLDLPHRAGMARYILNHQQADGGWGMNIAGTSTSFGTTLNYAALRLLGVAPTHPACAKARAFLATRGGACVSPLWAKAWLALLGAYDWSCLLYTSDAADD